MIVNDILQPFYFDRLPVRGALVQLRQTQFDLLANRDYPLSIASLLGQGAAATSLIASLMKFSGRLTLQLSGNGPLSIFVIQSTDDLSLRGMALVDDRALPSAAELDFRTLTKGSRCSLAVEAKNLRERYQGIVAVDAPSLERSLDQYFKASVQVPTRLWLQAGPDVAGGLMLQLIDGAGAGDIAEEWSRLQLLAETLPPHELGSGDGVALLRRIFREDDLRVPPGRPVRFHCGCSRERAGRAVMLLGKADALQAVTEQGVLNVTCEFCGNEHRLDAVDVTELFSGSGEPASSGIH